jgi:hypothetical protein
MFEPNKVFGKSANGFRQHQPASLLIKKKGSPDISLQSKHFSSTPRRVIRLQQRCNLDSHRDDAYTSFSDLTGNLLHTLCRLGDRGCANRFNLGSPAEIFSHVLPSNLQIGEANGYAPV